MTTAHTTDVACRAEAIYATRLKESLEVSHPDKFVAIEPESGEYYLGRTLSEAIALARKAHPGRMAHVVRVGHRAGVHFGTSLQ